MKTHIESYGERARTFSNFTEISGRYSVQEINEREILGDVIDKLCIKPSDSLLEIGCGVGNILVPMSFLVDSAVGIDHPDVIARFAQRFNSDKVKLLSGRFQEQELEDKFEKILIYSVLPTMPNESALFGFVEKALELLSSSGRMLLGDLSSQGRKERFLNSEQGKLFQQNWEELRKLEQGSEEPESNEDSVVFTDELLMELVLFIRKRGFHAYIVEQPATLPFGNTREDIVVVGPEWSN